MRLGLGANAAAVAADAGGRPGVAGLAGHSPGDVRGRRRGRDGLGPPAGRSLGRPRAAQSCAAPPRLPARGWRRTPRSATARVRAVPRCRCRPRHPRGPLPPWDTGAQSPKHTRARSNTRATQESVDVFCGRSAPGKFPWKEAPSGRGQTRKVQTSATQGIAAISFAGPMESRKKPPDGPPSGRRPK